MLKKIIIGLILLVFVGFGGLYLARNFLVKAAIEEAGNYALKVDTDLASVSLELGAGSMAMQDYHISNPPGYKAANFFEMEKAFLAVQTGSITDTLCIVDSLVLEGITLNLEQVDTKSNFKELMDNLKQLDLSSESSSETSLIISLLEIRDINANASLTALGKEQTQKSFAVNNITLHNVGGSDGANPSEVIATVMKELIEKSVVKGQALLPGDFGDLKEGAIEKAKDAVTDAVKDVGKSILGGDK